MPKALAEMTLEELWQRFPIELVPPRPEWPMMYADESAGLKNRLPADWIVRMEHIGSTAVGTIWAKAIVDILVETTGEADWEVLKILLLDAGYLCMSQSENRMAFNKGYTPQGFAPSVFADKGNALFNRIHRRWLFHHFPADLNGPAGYAPDAVDAF